MEALATRCNELKVVEALAKQGRPIACGITTPQVFIPVEMLQMGVHMELGAIPVLLGVLDAMIIPGAALPVVIDLLRQLDCKHAAIGSTIDNLRARLAS